MSGSFVQDIQRTARLIARSALTLLVIVSSFATILFCLHVGGYVEDFTWAAILSWFLQLHGTGRFAVLFALFGIAYFLYHAVRFVPIKDYREETVRCFRLAAEGKTYHYVKGTVNLEGREFTFRPLDQAIPAVSIPFEKIVDCRVDLDSVRFAYVLYAGFVDRANLAIKYIDDAESVAELSFRLAHDSVLIATLRNMFQNRYTISTE